MQYLDIRSSIKNCGMTQKKVPIAGERAEIQWGFVKSLTETQVGHVLGNSEDAQRRE
jgi:hypothetical protein